MASPRAFDALRFLLQLLAPAYISHHGGLADSPFERRNVKLVLVIDVLRVAPSDDAVLDVRAKLQTERHLRLSIES